jgi:hypothetical protein
MSSSDQPNVSPAVELSKFLPPSNTMSRRVSTDSLGPNQNAAIVYEVNLSVPKDFAKAYLEYLKEFTGKVAESVPGK